MARILVCHGAWSSGWVWKKMRPLLNSAGHELYVPTYTGLGERVHLAKPEVDLDLHIRDVMAVIDMEDLSGLTLLGHSYGGMVATGVADRLRDRIDRLVYLDAFVPLNGQSALDLMPEERRRKTLESVVEGWLLPPSPVPPDTSPEDAAWMKPRRVPQPVRTFQQPLRLSMDVPVADRTYIYCARIGAFDTFGPFAAMARREPGWRYLEMDASHSPHVTAPQALAQVLGEIVSRR